jgi:hypothetical protein
MYDRVQDLPDIVRKGLDGSTQMMVKGVLNSAIYDERMEPGLAMQRVQSVLKSAGYVWDGEKWNTTIGKKMAEGVIAKVQDEQRLVFGWANVVRDAADKIVLDRQNDFISDTHEIEKAAYHYVLHSRDGGAMHVIRGVSTLVESMVFTREKIAKLGIPEGILPEGWWIGFKVLNDDAWSLVKSGDFPGFSVHGKGKRTVKPVSEATHTTTGR